MNLPRVILASASPRRAQLMQKLGIQFEVMASDILEEMHNHLSPRELTVRHAFAKARKLALEFPDAVVIGADTVVVLDHRIFGKPRDKGDAARMLQQLQGKTHHVVTGVCVLCIDRKLRSAFTQTSSVTFKSMNPSQISDYLELVNPLDKAGSYAAQEHTELIIDHVLGSFDNVVGLPIEELRLVLKHFDAIEC